MRPTKKPLAAAAAANNNNGLSSYLLYILPCPSFSSLTHQLVAVNNGKVDEVSGF